MSRGDRLVGGTVLLVRVLRIGNYLFLAVALIASGASVVAAGALEARLDAKYHGVADPALVLAFIRVLLATGCVAVWPVARLLRALDEMLGTVRDGDPFVVANAARVRAVGWGLLALQLLDLGLGAATWWARAHRVEVADWQPSLTGWLAVLVAFVLARVFRAGAAMREDIEGTV